MSTRDEDAARVQGAIAIKVAAKEIDEQLPMLIEQSRIVARHQFIKFRALILAGFNEQQALQLVK
jgi:hypothetical protein